MTGQIKPVSLLQPIGPTGEIDCFGTAPLQATVLGKRYAALSNVVALEAGGRRAVTRKAVGAIYRTIAPWLEGHLIVLAALGTLDLVHLTDASVTKASA